MDVKTSKIDRRLDSYEIKFKRGESEELLNEVQEMEKNSEWVHGITSADLSLTPLLGPLFAEEDARAMNLDVDLVRDTSDGGTMLALSTGRSYELLRDTARPSLCETAKLYGSALGRMDQKAFAATINYGLAVAKGSTLMLRRYGKASALHSNADGGYQIMPMLDLLDSTLDMIDHRFGTADFIRGSNSHGYTSAEWELPDAQEKILKIYRESLGAVKSFYPVNAMPALRFASSDTAASCATLEPVFVLAKTNVGLPFCEGVRIRHTKRGSARDAMIDYREKIDGMYARFEESAEMIAKLSGITVYNGCNCVVSLCKKYNISKKWGEAARVEMEHLTAGGYPVTAHDLYLCMSEAIAEAIRSNASSFVIRNLEENIAKILRADWSEHDVGGVVAW